MKILTSICILSITLFVMNAQTNRSSKTPGVEMVDDKRADKITSGLYTLNDIPGHQEIFSGSTTHFSNISFRLESLVQKDGERHLQSEAEQILIIKEGEARVRLGREVRTIGPNSVIFLLPHVQGSIASITTRISYYRMVYTAMPSLTQEDNQDVNSFIIDYDNLPYRAHSKGGVRKYFNRSTAMLPYYEMHVTTLNPGLQSHPPHTHEAAEIILIIEGDTEEEIEGKTYRGQVGDVYFLGSNVPHAIRNIGDKPCQYFAFQWGKKR